MSIVHTRDAKIIGSMDKRKQEKKHTRKATTRKDREDTEQMGAQVTEYGVDY